MTGYDFDGRKYLKASKPQKEWGTKLIESIDFRDDDVVLDLGCGDGFLTRMIKERIGQGRVIGIDASDGMIAKAREYETPGLEFKLQDIDDLDYRETFSVIISNAALHWVKDHDKLLKNCYAALKEGGILRFNFAGDGNCSHFITVVREAMRQDEFCHYFRNFEWPWYMPGTKEYERIGSAALYSEFRVWDENADRYFRDEDEMIRWIDQPSLVPFLQYIPDADVREDFRAEMIGRMIERTEGEDGRCFETFRRINVFARK
ncbi:class I SAM-dependent methyltransferase [Methanofollis ethanolicus]|uniref:class I SAM-dependent methyltransferase n=1 Tax=Methanofollis ethanolicus TaxID=488124 RepID=UPI0008349B44|nr:class I SAM-dependent methyltransferase [Methanofollis ethanolicus]